MKLQIITAPHTFQRQSYLKFCFVVLTIEAENTDHFSSMISEEEQPRLQEGPEKMMEKLVSESGLSYKLESDHFTVNLE